MRRLITFFFDNADIFAPMLIAGLGILARSLATRKAQHYREAGILLAGVIEKYGPKLKEIVEQRRLGQSDQVADKVKEIARISDPGKANPSITLEERVINAVAGAPSDTALTEQEQDNERLMVSKNILHVDNVSSVEDTADRIAAKFAETERNKKWPTIK